jgi:hypothetical protein
VIVASAGGCAEDPAPLEGLRARVEQLDPPDRFRMSYRATGTDVLSCALPNRTFVLGVDLGEDLLVLEAPGAGPTPLAVRRNGQLSLHVSLFAPVPIDTEWVITDVGDLDGADAASVRRALGVDLASYLLGEGLPPSGESIAAAALAIATEVEAVVDADAEPDTEAQETFRLVLDPGRFVDEVADSGPDSPEAPQPEAPVVEIGLDDAMVMNVAVRPPAHEDADSAGWAIAFTHPAVPFDPPSTGPATPLGEVVEALAAPPITSCAIGDDDVSQEAP